MALGLDATVVIPTRNRCALLQRTLASALAQERVRHEVIVVDDGSTDRTQQVLEATRDARLRVIRNDASAGVAAARNEGLSAAGGRWIAFLDDDDLWAPLKLRLLLDAAVERKASFAYSAAVRVDLALNVLAVDAAPNPGALATELLRTNPMPGGCSNAIARADLLRSLGGFDENLHQLCDWDLWIRLAAAGPAAATEEALVAYAVHPGNMLLVDQAPVQREFAMMEEKHRSLGEAAGVRFNRLEFERWVARGRWRRGNRARAVAGWIRALLQSTGADRRFLAEQIRRRIGQPGFRPGARTPPGWLEGLR